MQNPEEQDEPKTPFELIAGFARCQNYPKDPLGVAALAQGLLRAQNTTGIPAQRIVDRCLEASQYCPTDHDMLAVAREMKIASMNAASQNQRKEWEAQYGPPRPFKPEVTPAQATERQRRAELWKQLRLKFPGKWPGWDTLSKAAEELGYEDYAEAWHRSVNHR